MLGLKCKAAVLAALALSACATAKDPAYKVEYVDRPVIQQKACLSPSDVPSRPAPLGSSAIPTNLERALSVALAKVSEWTRYGNKADVIMKTCAK